MRTTVVLSDDLIKELYEATSLKTKTQAVNFALQDWLKRIRREKLKSLKGKVRIEMDLSSLRDLDKMKDGYE